MSSEINAFHVGDNLSIMKGMPDSFVDLIYADPPFNSGRVYSGKEGSGAEGASFNDVWTWGKKEIDLYILLREKDLILANTILNSWLPSMQSYLLFMSLRLIEMRRILKDTGSIYLHCDTSASHYLKCICDIIFGHKNFINEIVWHYSGGGRSTKYFSKKHDTILWYKKSNEFTFNIDSVRVPYSETSGLAKSGIKVSSTGKKYYPHPAGTPLDDVWYIPIINQLAKERNGYPTQKPLVLLSRIIEASSNRGDTILDPFAGSGTSLISAERLGRAWVGIDSEATAKEVFYSRLALETNQGSLLT